MPPIRHNKREEITLNAEVYNKRIVIQQTALSADGIGGFVNTWTTYLTTWAHVEPWKGQERFIQDQIYPTLWIRLLMRYRPTENINTSMRILYRDRIFNIRSVQVLAEAQTVIELLAEELQAVGTI